MEFKKMNDQELAKILWDYNALPENPKKSDLIFVPGSTDIRVAKRAAELFKLGFAPYILFTGNEGALSKDLFDKPEAEVFAEVARQEGVPAGIILTEVESTNTGDNIRLSRKLLKECELDIKTILVVQKPYALRRMYATFKKQWPEIKFSLASTNISFEEYPDEVFSEERLIGTLVKTTDRIIKYPTKKYQHQIRQRIPGEVRAAFNELVSRGYTSRL